MKEEIIKLMVKSGILRIMQVDAEKIKSMVKSAEITADFVKKMQLNDASTTIIFREIYESIRQLGESYWRALGYNPSNHEISLDILKELNISEGFRLNFLSRFKQIRHEINYEGQRASEQQAKEIIEFWDKCSKDIIKIIFEKINIK